MNKIREGKEKEMTTEEADKGTEKDGMASAAKKKLNDEREKEKGQ